MDPREFVQLATLDKDGATYDATGIFLDLTLMDGYPVRAQLVRNRTHEPLHSGDLFSVVYPEGNPDGRALAFGPLANSRDEVPSEIINDPASFWLVSNSGESVKVKTLGSGDVEITSGGDIAANASGKAEVTATGDVNVSSTGGQVLVKAATFIDLGQAVNPLDFAVVGSWVEPLTGIPVFTLGGCSALVKVKK